MPAGYEFSNLLDSIIAVSTGEAGLSAETKSALAELTERRQDQGLRHPDLTALPPGRAPGAAHGDRLAKSHRRVHRGQ